VLKLITAGRVELGSPDAEEHRANRSQRSRRVGPGYIAAMQDTTWQALLSLVGTWEGYGTIEYPTMDPLVYREVLESRSSNSGSPYCLSPQGVNATPSARVVLSRQEVCGVEEVYGGGDRRGVGATEGG